MLTSFVLWVVFSFVFAGKLPDGQQYAPYLMAGIVLNSFFNQGLMISAESIASNAGVLTKIYVPPQVFPISVALAGLVNFFIGLIPLAIVVYISGQSLALTFPLVIIVGFFLALLVAGLGRRLLAAHLERALLAELRQNLDRALAELRERGWTLGGEQSGHIIDMGFVPSGDGIASALLTLEALAGSDLAERSAMEKLPQRLVNVKVADKARALAAVAGPADDANQVLSGQGRVLVRASGTEELVRVMVEAPDQAQCDEICASLVAVVEAAG
jgi:hypothetical protein